LAAAGEIVAILPIKNSKIEYLPIQVSTDAYLLYPKENLTDLRLSWQLPLNLTAPVTDDQTIGYLMVYDSKDNQIMNVRLSAAVDASESFSLFNRLFVQ